jgi:hypothetical protein
MCGHIFYHFAKKVYCLAPTRIMPAMQIIKTSSTQQIPEYHRKMIKMSSDQMRPNIKQNPVVICGLFIY